RAAARPPASRGGSPWSSPGNWPRRGIPTRRSGSRRRRRISIGRARNEPVGKKEPRPLSRPGRPVWSSDQWCGRACGRAGLFLGGVLPFGSVVVASRVTVFPLLVVVTFLVAVLPFGPVKVPWRVIVLPSFVQVVWPVAVLPLGPVAVTSLVTVLPSVVAGAGAS